MRYFVSRHPGAEQWMREQGIQWDIHVAHLENFAQLQAGDIVMGTLPINQAAEVCARGARYLHLSLCVPPQWRGRELTSDQLRQLGASLQAFEIRASG